MRTFREDAWTAIVVAAGRGERFGASKQFVEIAGIPMVAWSLRAFAQMPEVATIIVATEAEWMARMRDVADTYAPQCEVTVIAGGNTRQNSARNGILAASSGCERLFVHDGARPLVSVADVRVAMQLVAPGRASALGSPVIDTIKTVDRKMHRVLETLDRGSLWAAQTPQLATAADLARAHEHAARDGVDATDDAMLLERVDVAVTMVAASHENFKVTHRVDRDRAEAVLRERTAGSVR